MEVLREVAMNKLAPAGKEAWPADALQLPNAEVPGVTIVHSVITSPALARYS